MSTKLVNIGRNALRAGYGREMLRKLWLRWRERKAPSRDAVAQWCREHEIEASTWAREIDEALWAEAEAFARDQQQFAERRMETLGVRLGGAGFYALLYFLARLQRPEVIVETGVAAGFSSRAFLMALRKNGRGTLHSSDFPYFRLAEPERYIGCLVEPELRGGWTLLIEGDHSNLPKISRSVERIDLLHYDSDKSYHGREFALDALGRLLSDDGLIVFDDIQDNFHFRDFVGWRAKPFLVFAHAGKWIGLTGGDPRFYAASGGKATQKSRAATTTG